MVLLPRKNDFLHSCASSCTFSYVLWISTINLLCSFCEYYIIEDLLAFSCLCIRKQTCWIFLFVEHASELFKFPMQATTLSMDCFFLIVISPFSTLKWVHCWIEAWMVYLLVLSLSLKELFSILPLVWCYCRFLLIFTRLGDFQIHFISGYLFVKEFSVFLARTYGLSSLIYYFEELLHT